MADVRLQKSWMVSRTLLERARRVLPVGPEQRYVTQLARYHEFLEHNESDSGPPGPRASRAVDRLLWRPKSLPGIL